MGRTIRYPSLLSRPGTSSPTRGTFRNFDVGRHPRRTTVKCLASAVSSRLAPVILALLVLVVPARVGLAQEAPKPLAPDGAAYGLTLADWSVAWMEWIFSIPKASNPDFRNDETGVHFGVGQHGPVWFIPGFDPGTSGARSITIPAGKSILYSPAGGAAFNAPGAETEEQLLARAGAEGAAFLDAITVLEVSLDGVPISDVKRYRVASPVFTFTVPPGNIWGVPVTAGKEQRAVGAGVWYWLLFPALPVGRHLLVERLEGVFPEDNTRYKSEWTINLIVQKPNEPLP
jgi:hypothetical protein